MDLHRRFKIKGGERGVNFDCRHIQGTGAETSKKSMGFPDTFGRKFCTKNGQGMGVCNCGKNRDAILV